MANSGTSFRHDIRAKTDASQQEGHRDSKAILGSKGTITDYIVSLGFDVENTTKAEIDRLCRGQPLGGGLEGEGE